MMTLLQDVRHGLRMLVKNPTLTLVVVTTLALGIGANTAVFSVVNGVLLKPLPFREPQQLVGLRETLPDEGVIPAAYRTFAEWRDRNTVFQSIAGIVSWNPNLESGNEPIRIEGAIVSASFFDVMGMKPVLGRTFVPEEERPDSEPVVVLSYELWKQQFGGQADIVGQVARINGRNYNVIGVMSPGVSDAELGWMSIWTVLRTNDQAARANPGRYLKMNARLKPGISIEQAKQELEGIMRLLRNDFPETHGKAYGAEVRCLSEFLVPNGTRKALLILQGVVGCVLLIACANVANLMLAKGATREKEIAIRTALGASRSRVLRQLLVENLNISLLGAAIALVVAKLALIFLVNLGLKAIPRLNDGRLDASVLGFTLGLAVLAAVVFGFAPALAATKTEVSGILKEGGRGGAEQRQNRLRNMLIVSEIALALVLLIASGLLIKSYSRLTEVKLGFEPNNVLTMEVNLPAARYKERAQVVNFYRELLENVSALPNVATVSAAQSLPLRGPIYTDPVFIEGQPVPPTGQEPYIRQNIVTSDFFRAMGMQLIEGRPFNEQEVWGSGGSLIINEAFARRFFPDGKFLGRRIKLAEDKPWLTVVGVVANTVQDKFGEQTIPEMFYPYVVSPDEQPLSFMTLVIGTTVEPTLLVNNVRDQVRRLDPALPVSKIQTMGAITDAAVSLPRFNMLILSLFAGMSIALAAVGVYGLISYSVVRRTREIGIRLALGSQAGSVLKLILRKGMSLTLLGVVIGLVGSFVLMRILESLLFSVTATDPLVFVSATALLMLVALLACYLPARRALKIDPVVALREE